MEEILEYENRDQLYKFLIEDFGFVKVAEYYDAHSFGNFYITLEGRDFFLSYVNDRSFLEINIASKLKRKESLSLSFVKNYIYNPHNINPKEKKGMNNVKRIEELNTFLKTDFSEISFLFNTANYQYTTNRIKELLKQQYFLKD